MFMVYKEERNLWAYECTLRSIGIAPPILSFPSFFFPLSLFDHQPLQLRHFCLLYKFPCLPPVFSTPLTMVDYILICRSYWHSEHNFSFFMVLFCNYFKFTEE